ncbi:FKBP-type peptidyl-prolyl cis-trans isomerase SlyD [gamma proteobacterium IMCC2047]|nr:FKBP-type peptidyl-prolyl cis-trans isomerase SlyD [gamma proteobacterium IMCC2047]
MIITGKVVATLHYTATDDNGQQVDASPEWEPLTYMHNTHGLLPGLEKALEGHKAGDQLQVTVQPEDGYGQPDAELIHKVPLTAFADVGPLEVGMQFELESEEGHGEQFTVTAIDGDEVTIDANHSLAGKVLHFDVRIESLREATSLELEVGHPLEGILE